MPDRTRLIAAGFAVVVFALTYAIVAQLTHPGRAVSAGVLLAGGTGALIWFAPSDRKAMARGILALAIAALSAPASGLVAAQTDFLFGAFTQDGFDADHFDRFEAIFQTGYTLVGVGLAAGIVLAIVGWRLHRTRPGDTR